MADTQTAPQASAGLQPPIAPEGSVTEAQEALLSLLEPGEETPETEEAQPTEEEESQPEEEDESFEEESEEEEEADSEEEAEEESEEPDEEEEEALYAVTVNGEEREVSLDELLSGYSRQSDYTRKTQELSQERKQIESLEQKYNSEVAQIQSERQQYMINLQQIIESATGDLQQFSNVDWASLKESDPIEYVTKREEFRESQEKIQAIQQQHEAARQRHLSEEEALRKTVVKEEHKKLVESMPEWGDPDVQKKLASNLKSYGIEQGFTNEELSQLVDHRSVIILSKALKFDQMQKADVKSKKIKNKPKVIRAGKGKSKSDSNKSQRTAQMKRLRGTGHLDDATALLEDFIDI